MSNRNATASWSGFSHQGQVGLLVALRKMQEEGINLNTHFVQFETREDVAIYEEKEGNREYLTVHQVKAYYSENRKSGYNSVLNGNFDLGKENYLHTVLKIRDWDTSTTTNNNGVLRYLYTEGQYHCGTTEIETFIKEELVKILNENEAIINDAYSRLVLELDNLIRKEHQKAHKHLFDIKFSLHEIDQLIRDTGRFLDKQIYDCRKSFYDTYIHQYCKVDLPPERITLIEDLIKRINSLDNDNFHLFLQRMSLNLHPSELQGTQNSYNRDGLRQVFFKIIFEIIHTDPEIIENAVKYQKPGNSGHYVVTTIIEEEDNQLEVVENIMENLTSQNLLWEKHSLINKDISCELSRNPSITKVATSAEIAEDQDKFMSFSNSRLIKRSDAIQKLNDAGNN